MGKKIFIILAVISLVSFGININKYFNNKSLQDRVEKSKYERHTELKSHNGDITYIPVILKGKFLHDHTVFAYDYNYPQRYVVLTPYQLHDGEVFLVARGITSCNSIDKEHILMQNAESIFGYIVPSQKKPFFSSYADKRNKIWFCINAQSISRHTKLNLNDNFVIATHHNKKLFSEYLLPVEVNFFLDSIYGHSSLIFSIIFFLVFILSVVGAVYDKKNK